MIALCIVIILTLICVILCLTKLRFTALYDETLTLKLKVLFLEFTLVPFEKQQKKKRKKKVLKKKNKQTDNKKEKKPSFIKKLSQKKGVEGLLSMLSEIAELLSSTVKGIFTNVVIERFDLSFIVVGEDAADTALKYGKLCGVVYSTVSVICSTAKCEDYNVNVTPDFDDDAKMKACCDTQFYIRVYFVLRYGLKALFKLVMIRYRR